MVLYNVMCQHQEDLYNTAYCYFPSNQYLILENHICVKDPFKIHLKDPFKTQDRHMDFNVTE